MKSQTKMRFFMLGEKLKRYRKDRKLSQKAIGEIVKRDIQTIRSWEDGKSEPKASELVKLSDFYGVSLDEICRGEETMLDKKIQIQIAETRKLNEEEKKCIDMMLEAIISRHYANSIKFTD
ncbi:TPA: helix-turn-helix transcriptional regulator [Escherichia coli]|nr:helix-turn-helix transcriptional regulator [Escherichia coli]HBA9701455.1 helix-turn-helix transcriptional regulator [Escherichia coli]